MLMLGRPHDSYFARAEGAIFLVGFGKFFLKCAVERHFLYPEHISVVFAKNNDTKIMILFWKLGDQAHPSPPLLRRPCRNS